MTRELLNQHRFLSGSFAADSSRTQVLDVIRMTDAPAFDTVKWDLDNCQPLQYYLLELPSPDQRDTSKGEAMGAKGHQ